MNKTQKLKATVEDISFETTFANLPSQFLPLIPMLEANPYSGAYGVHVSNGAALCIQLEFVGKRPKAKTPSQIFGYDEKEFLEKQYK